MKTPSKIKAEIARLEKLASTYPENGRTSFKISIRTLKWVLDGKVTNWYRIITIIIGALLFLGVGYVIYQSMGMHGR